MEQTKEALKNLEVKRVGLNDYNLKYDYVLDFSATKTEIEMEREQDNKSMKRIYKTVSDFFLRHYHFKTIEREDKSECFIYNGGIYVPQAFTLVDRETHRMLEDAYSQHSPNAILAHIKAQTYISEDNFRVKDPLLLPLQNGILNVKTRELLDFDPKYYFFDKLPITYNEDAECWEVKEFFDQVLPIVDDVFLLQQIFGYCLYRDYHIHKFFVFSGGGRNGKGVTLSLLSKLLGAEFTSHHSLFKLSDGGFMVSELFRKLANINADLPDGVIKDTGMLKQLCGGDRISANRKFLPSISFQNYAKLIFSTNSMPTFHDNSEGWKRRWVLLEFKEKFLTEKEIGELLEEEKEHVNIADADLLDKLSTPENMSGLLNWALDGLQTIFEDGYFTTSKSDKEAWRVIMMKGDPYSVFCEEMLEEAPLMYITKSALRQLFINWANENGLSVKLVNKELKNAIENLPYPVDEGQRAEVHGQRCWLGVKLKE